MNNTKKYISVFKETFNVEEDELNQDFTFKDREEWDSMSHMTLISSLEDEFDIMFDTEDILNYGSFENGINIVRKYGVEI